MIAFQSKRDGGDFQVFVMDRDGNGKKRLSDGKGYAGQPQWSPDGKSILYVAGDQATGSTHDLYVVPESRNVPRTTLTRQGLIDFSRDHVPLLLMAGDSDHLTPAPMIRRNARRYELMVDVREFSGRSHLICNQDGWEEVADEAFDFATASV
jgi:pimeloyl-ACP methyl ester carboxylesterase